MSRSAEPAEVEVDQAPSASDVQCGVGIGAEAAELTFGQRFHRATCVWIKAAGATFGIY